MFNFFKKNEHILKKSFTIPRMQRILNKLKIRI